jgi:aminodeoxyfutalosine deaminase
VHGVDIRFTPDITRDFPVEIADHLVRWAVKYRERGVVGISLGGSEHKYPPELFERPFAAAREGGLKAAPHAGEVAGPASVRGALDVLRADRLRHGVRAVEDPALLAEIAARGVVCDVTPTSNVLLGVVPSLAEHPLPRMLAAGVRCSISSDDPVLMDTTLSRDCAAAAGLGHTPRDMFEHALGGVFCDDSTKARLRRLGDAFDWVGASG